MRRTGMVAIAGVALLAATMAFAGQAKRGGGADLSTLRTVTGTVESVAMDYGLGHPGFILNSNEEGALQVNLGPYWYLVANNFALGVGDQVTARVADCLKTTTVGDVVAFEVTDITSGTSILLRNDQGLPLWKGAKKGHGNGGGNGGGQGNGGGNGARNGGYNAGLQVDLATLIQVEGTLTAVNLGLGTHTNSVTLQAMDGTQYTVTLGPFWYMEQNGFTLQQGDAVSISMALCQGQWVAFAVTKTATGVTLQFRDDQGVPLWLN